MKKFKKEYVLLGVGVYGLLLLIYQQALHIPYFGDDFQYVFPQPGEMVFGNFLHHAPTTEWYRPLQSMVLASIQMFWDTNTLPIRILHLLIHSTIAVLIYRALRSWGSHRASAITASFLFAVTQASVYPMTKDVMVSQMMSSLFGVLTLWTLYRGMKSLREGQKFPASRMAMSLLTFALALFSKETSVGLCLGVFAVLWSMEPSPESVGVRIRRVGMRIAPFVVMSIVYLAMRLSAGAVMPMVGNQDVYQFHFGLNIFKNLGLFAFQSVLPFSSALVMRALYDRDIFQLVGIFAISAILGIAWIYGIMKSSRRRLALALLGLALLSLTPAIFLNHVSESYLYNALPYIMVVFGIAIEYYWSVAPRKIAFPFALLLSVAFVANVSGAIQKTSALAEESARAQVLMPQIYPILSSLPINGRLYLVNPVVHEFEYSVFAMKGFGPVKYAEPWLRGHTQRPDVQIYVLDSLEYRDSAVLHPGIALSLEMATLRVKPF